MGDLTNNVKEYSHIVFKIEDAKKYLIPTECDQLLSLLSMISQGRINEGKKINEYLVVNKDEEYSEKIQEVIDEGEKLKSDFLEFAEYLKEIKSKNILSLSGEKREFLLYLIINKELSEDFIRDLPEDYINWYLTSKHQKLSESFIRDFKDKVNWESISSKQVLTEDFIREFKDKVHWKNISQYQKLSEEFIREFKDKLDWWNISIYQVLSESFIKEFKDKLNWYYISEWQNLSEDFIKEFQYKIDWNDVSCKQKLSEDFIREFKDKVNWNNIKINKKITLSDAFKEEMKDYLK